MIKRRAHKLKYIQVESSGATQDANGDWIPGTKTETEIIINCRADINSSGRTIKNNDGQDFVYNLSIYLDSIPESLKKGTHVEILKAGKVIGKGNVIMPFEYQATNKIWI